jgi:hypothetical protein
MRITSTLLLILATLTSILAKKPLVVQNNIIYGGNNGTGSIANNTITVSGRQTQVVQTNIARGTGATIGPNKITVTGRQRGSWWPWGGGARVGPEVVVNNIHVDGNVNSRQRSTGGARERPWWKFW